MIVKPIKTRRFIENEKILPFIEKYIKKVKDKSVIVITSKIIALSEGRTVVPKDEKTKEKIIKAESDFSMHTKYAWLTIKNGVVMASAGIDESNANGKLILLPKDSFKTASLIRKALKKKLKVKNLGVLITDSRTIPFRGGICGVALGYAGFSGIKDYIKKPDLFGRRFKFSCVDVAYSLASAAVLAMGEGNERQPLAIIENAPIEFQEKVREKELHIDIKNDMYAPIVAKFYKK